MVDSWWSSWVGAAVPYGVLLRQFVDRRITADEFEVVFLRLYKHDPEEWPSEVFVVLDTLFADVDDYCADETLRVEVGGLDAAALRKRATVAFARLEKLVG